MKFNLFDNFKVNQEYKKIKNVINYAPKNITPEFIKTIPDFNIREKIYITYDSFSQEEFDNFFNLYRLDKDIAMKTLDSGIIIYSNETVNLIKNNLDKIKLLISYEVDINFIFNTFGQIAEKIDKYYKLCSHYGKDVVQYLSDKNMSFLENDKITKLDRKFVLENIDELKEICGLSEVKFNCLLKLYRENSDKYSFAKKFIFNDEFYNDNIISFLEAFQFDENLVDIIKTNGIKDINLLRNLIISDLILNNNYNIKINNGYNRNKFMEQSFNYLINYYKNMGDLYYYKDTLLLLNSRSTIKADNDFRNKYKSVFNIKNKYYSKLSNKNKFFLDIFLNILSSTSFEEVDKNIYLLNKNEFNIDDFVSEIKKVESEQFNDALFKPNLNAGYINDDGIRIIDSNSIDLSSFKMFVHSVGKTGNDAHNDDIAEELLTNPSKWNHIDGGSDFMSLSLISENQTSTYGVKNVFDLILGFDAENIEINTVSRGDATTPMKKNNSYNDLATAMNSYTPENLIYNSMLLRFKGLDEGSYNEIHINRNKQMVPKYIVLKQGFDRGCEYNDYVKKWAKYYNIPIIILDGKKIKFNALKGVKEKCNLMKETGITYEKFIDLLHDIDTINNVNNTPRFFNYYEIFDFLVNLCEHNYENFIEFQKIIDLAGDNFNNLLLIDVNDRSTEIDIRKREKRKLDISEFYRKLEYLKNKYNTKEIEIEHKLGFVAINCVFLSLTVILIFTLIYILFKYFN